MIGILVSFPFSGHFWWSERRIKLPLPVVCGWLPLHIYVFSMCGKLCSCLTIFTAFPIPSCFPVSGSLWPVKNVLLTRWQHSWLEALRVALAPPNSYFPTGNVTSNVLESSCSIILGPGARKEKTQSRALSHLSVGKWCEWAGQQVFSKWQRHSRCLLW